MARLPLSANTKENNEGLDDYTPIPAGDVLAYITKSEYKKTKAKTGTYLQLIWKVQSEKYRGRTLFDNLNLDNPNPIAVEIANKTLNSICKACDKIGVQDSEELHGILCKLTLSVSPATATQPASNNIKAYNKASEADAIPVDTEGAVQPNKSAKPLVSKKLPWETDDDIPF